MAIEYGAYHLSNNPSAYQPVRTNNFRFLVQGLDRLLKVGGDATNDNDYFKNVQEVLECSVKSFEPPHFTQKDLTVQKGNSKIHFAGTPDFNKTSLVITDYAGANGKSMLEAWQALSYDVINDVIPSSTNYKVDAVVLEYLPDDTLVRYWELKGCWVSGIKEDGYDNENSSIKKVTADIIYDYAIPHLPDDIQ